MNISFRLYSKICRMGLVGALALALAASIRAEDAARPGLHLDPDEWAAAEQTEIESDRGSMNFRTGIATFEGNVLVTDKDVRMSSDRLIAQLDAENQIKSLEARGNVVITQAAQDRVARSGYALYTVETRTVILKENPRLEIGDSILDNAYQITYDMDGEQITTQAAPGQRTRVFIPTARESTATPEEPEKER